MKKLQIAATTALAGKSDKEKISSLCKAFEISSKETARLETSYYTLNKQFKHLNSELQETNQKLQNKVAELDIITAYLKSILDHIVQGIIFIDLSGTVTTYNKAAETILGIPAAEVLFNSFWQQFKDDVFGFSMSEALNKKTALQKPGVTTFCATYTAPNHPQSEIEVVVTFDLKELTEHIDVNPAADAAFPAHSIPTQGMIVMIKDVTEMRHLQTLANRTNRIKELGEMAAHVAHEIRNPLGGIKGFASLLKRDLADNPKLQQMAGYIVEGTDNLNSLVNQVLHYTRPVHTHLETVNLIALLQETKHHIMADSSMEGKHIDISIDSNLKELLIPLDPPLFKSALLNLIVNAIQAMPHGGTISLKVQKKHGQATLSITDTGTGMSEEHMAKLYSPFFTTKPDGNGLGLPDVQKVVQAHGGSIDVSSAIGQGTTFVIKLPLQQRQG